MRSKLFSVFLSATFLSTAMLSGCSISPVGVRRMDPEAVHRSVTANALTENKPSIDTVNVLHRYGLFADFKKTPAHALAELHRIVLETDDNDTWFALAELSFLHADRTHDRNYAMMAAIYAWSYLFGGTSPQPFDPRFRLASDIYNLGLTQGLEPSRKIGVIVQAADVNLPIGHLVVAFDPECLDWNGRKLRDFVPVAELEVRGLNNRFRTPGVGAPLAASAAALHADHGDDFLAPKLKIPVTALVRIENVRKQIRSGTIHARLELHTDPNEEHVQIGDRDVPLEKEPSAVLASMVAEQPVIKQEILAFIGTVVQHQDKGLLAALRPHVRGRIPVVYVHGTASSPARWAEMINVLDNDPRLNEVYEPWLFTYNSGSPIIYSSYLLRQALTQAVQSLDPAGTDDKLRDMVVIGHSQGGLLTKMTAVDSGDRFWKNVSSKRFEDVKLSDENRELLRSVGFIKPLPFVRRVVFICTPHRGSYLAASGWVRSIITRLVSLPARVTKITASLVTLNLDRVDVTSLQRVNAVDNMAPGNGFIKTLAEIPVAPGIASNSIVAVQGTGPIETGDDGVVKYTSAHIEGVESEKIVRSTHSTQAVPETIEEVRRILLQHEAWVTAGPVKVASPASQAASKPGTASAAAAAGGATSKSL
ncbi:MAG TPA: alpha/beta hydrolase [Candidatus Limnocylindrales bacterium]|nr:alpha/beta hydrolase [Candidatus Limnocylindrales bacterium]